MAILKKSSSLGIKGVTDYQLLADRTIVRILNKLPQQFHRDIDYLFKGKRIRSHLMFSLASRVGCKLSYTVLPAVGVEIVHTISLIHDDVIDRQMMRRDHPTLHRLYGNRVAVFIGSFLLHCLGSEMNRYRHSREVIDVLYLKIAELCRGEMEQDIPTGITSPGQRDYLRMIRRKTGSLFSYSFMVPVLLSNKKDTSLEMVRFAEECGYLFGLGFQLADDLADLEEDMAVIRSEKIHGKEGTTLERLFSYPILLWKEIDPSGFEQYLHRLAKERSKVKINKVVEKLRVMIIREIERELDQLEAKSQKYNQYASQIFDFMKEEINRLFKKQ